MHIANIFGGPSVFSLYATSSCSIGIPVMTDCNDDQQLCGNSLIQQLKANIKLLSDAIDKVNASTLKTPDPAQDIESIMPELNNYIIGNTSIRLPCTLTPEARETAIQHFSNNMACKIPCSHEIVHSNTATVTSADRIIESFYTVPLYAGSKTSIDSGVELNLSSFTNYDKDIISRHFQTMNNNRIALPNSNAGSQFVLFPSLAASVTELVMNAGRFIRTYENVLLLDERQTLYPLTNQLIVSVTEMMHLIKYELASIEQKLQIAQSDCATQPTAIYYMIRKRFQAIKNVSLTSLHQLLPELKTLASNILQILDSSTAMTVLDKEKLQISSINVASNIAKQLLEVVKHIGVIVPLSVWSISDSEESIPLLIIENEYNKPKLLAALEHVDTIVKIYNSLLSKPEQFLQSLDEVFERMYFSQHNVSINHPSKLKSIMKKVKNFIPWHNRAIEQLATDNNMHSIITEAQGNFISHNRTETKEQAITRHVKNVISLTDKNSSANNPDINELFSKFKKISSDLRAANYPDILNIVNGIITTICTVRTNPTSIYSATLHTSQKKMLQSLQQLKHQLLSQENMIEDLSSIQKLVSGTTLPSNTHARSTEQSSEPAKAVEVIARWMLNQITIDPNDFKTQIVGTMGLVKDISLFTSEQQQQYDQMVQKLKDPNSTLYKLLQQIHSEYTLSDFCKILADEANNNHALVIPNKVIDISCSAKTKEIVFAKNKSWQIGDSTIIMQKHLLELMCNNTTTYQNKKIRVIACTINLFAQKIINSTDKIREAFVQKLKQDRNEQAAVTNSNSTLFSRGKRLTNVSIQDYLSNLISLKSAATNLSLNNSAYEINNLIKDNGLEQEVSLSDKQGNKINIQISAYYTNVKADSQLRYVTSQQILNILRFNLLNKVQYELNTSISTTRDALPQAPMDILQPAIKYWNDQLQSIEAYLGIPNALAKSVMPLDNYEARVQLNLKLEKFAKAINNTYAVIYDANIAPQKKIVALTILWCNVHALVVQTLPAIYHKEIRLFTSEGIEIMQELQNTYIHWYNNSSILKLFGYLIATLPELAAEDAVAESSTDTNKPNSSILVKTALNYLGKTVSPHNETIYFTEKQLQVQLKLIGDQKLGTLSGTSAIHVPQTMYNPKDWEINIDTSSSCKTVAQLRYDIASNCTVDSAAVTIETIPAKGFLCWKRPERTNVLNTLEQQLCKHISKYLNTMPCLAKVCLRNSNQEIPKDLIRAIQQICTNYDVWTKLDDLDKQVKACTIVIAPTPKAVISAGTPEQYIDNATKSAPTTDRKELADAPALQKAELTIVGQPSVVARAPVSSMKN
jgi:hypothetical protein